MTELLHVQAYCPHSHLCRCADHISASERDDTFSVHPGDIGPKANTPQRFAPSGYKRSEPKPVAMSALGHLPTWRLVLALSALPPKAEMKADIGDVGLVPVGDIGRQP